MADVLPFFQDAAFDDDATQVMGKAFDRACQSLHDNGQPDLVRQIIAKRVIEAHGGTVSLKATDAPGASFRIILPLDKPEVSGTDVEVQGVDVDST